MVKIVPAIAALTLICAAALPVPAAAAERQSGVTQQTQSTEFSSQRRYYRGRYYARRYYAPRRYYPAYGYAAPYPYYGYPYGYYRPGPAISFGVGPFGFGLF